MDPALWSDLPLHLLESILLFLPITSLLSLQTLSKSIRNSIVSSPPASITHHHRISSLPPSNQKRQQPFFLMFALQLSHRVGAAYDVELEQWHHIPFSNFLSAPSSESFVLLGADGGLFCLEGSAGSRERSSIYVSNPITRRQRKLPHLLSMPSPRFLIMAANRFRTGYKILVTHQGDCLSSQVYDSESNSWKMTGVLHRRTPLITGAVLHKGLVYCLTMKPDGVLKFDLDKGSWHESGVVMPPSLVCHRLFESRSGELMMVGGVEENGALKGVYFWKLVRATDHEEWVEVKRVPEDLFKLFFVSASGHFMCVALGDHVCFHDYQFPHVLMYDLARDTWKWLSPSSHFQNVGYQYLLGFAFQPRLDASV